MVVYICYIDIVIVVYVYSIDIVVYVYHTYIHTYIMYSSAAPEENYNSADDQKHTSLKRFVKLWTKRLQNADRAEHKSATHTYIQYILMYICA